MMNLNKPLLMHEPGTTSFIAMYNAYQKVVLVDASNLFTLVCLWIAITIVDLGGMDPLEAKFGPLVGGYAKYKKGKRPHYTIGHQFSFADMVHTIAFAALGKFCNLL
jgi:hypothetical protein